MYRRGLRNTPASRADRIVCSMPTPLTDLTLLLRSMQPIRNPGVYAYASVPHSNDVRTLEPSVTVREHEGITVVPVTNGEALTPTAAA